MKNYIDKIFCGLAAVMLVAMMSLATSCGGDDDVDPVNPDTPDNTDTTTTVKVTGVSVDPAELNLAIDATAKLTATVTPTNASNTNVTWSSSSTDVASVDSEGNVTAVGAGSATITVTTEDGSHTATCSVKVTIPVTGISLNKTSISLVNGSLDTLVATVTPEDATDKSYTFSSADSSIATVSEDGVITGIKGGKTTITVTTTDGGHTATADVSVHFESDLKVFDVTNNVYIEDSIGFVPKDTIRLTVKDVTDPDLTASESSLSFTIDWPEVAQPTVKTVDGVGVIELVAIQTGKAVLSLKYEGETGKLEKSITVYVDHVEGTLPDIPIHQAGL